MNGGIYPKFSKRISAWVWHLFVDTGRKLNVHKTFRRRPGRLLNVLCTFDLCHVSTGSTFANIFWCFLFGVIECDAAIWHYLVLVTVYFLTSSKKKVCCTSSKAQRRCDNVVTMWLLTCRIVVARSKMRVVTTSISLALWQRRCQDVATMLL